MDRKEAFHSVRKQEKEDETQRILQPWLTEVTDRGRGRERDRDKRQNPTHNAGWHLHGRGVNTHVSRNTGDRLNDNGNKVTTFTCT